MDRLASITKDGNHEITPDAISFCFHCRAVLKLSPDLTLREFTVDELLDLRADPETRILIDAAQEALAKTQKVKEMVEALPGDRPKCPACGHPFPIAEFVAENGHAPEPGRVTVCPSCLKFSRFNDKCELERMTEEDMIAFANTPEGQKELLHLLNFLEEVGKEMESSKSPE